MIYRSAAVLYGADDGRWIGNKWRWSVAI